MDIYYALRGNGQVVLRELTQDEAETLVLNAAGPDNVELMREHLKTIYGDLARGCSSRSCALTMQPYTYVSFLRRA